MPNGALIIGINQYNKATTGQDPMNVTLLRHSIRPEREIWRFIGRGCLVAGHRADGQRKRSRLSDEQIIAIMKEQEAGTATAEVCRRHGISGATFYKWKAKYGGLEVSEAKRLRSLEDENAKLKKLLTEAMLDIAVLKDISLKKMVTPDAKWNAVAQPARQAYGQCSP